MPNGHEEHRNRIRQKSRFWSVIWQVGDAAYYLGLLASVISPLVVLGVSIHDFESLGTLLRRTGLAAVLFLSCFPIGLIVCCALKWLSERCAGLE